MIENIKNNDIEQEKLEESTRQVFTQRVSDW
jgi:hypothetical protein